MTFITRQIYETSNKENWEFVPLGRVNNMIFAKMFQFIQSFVESLNFPSKLQFRIPFDARQPFQHLVSQGHLRLPESNIPA
jgi:hypothetical protein